MMRTEQLSQYEKEEAMRISILRAAGLVELRKQPPVGNKEK